MIQSEAVDATAATDAVAGASHPATVPVPPPAVSAVLAVVLVGSGACVDAGLAATCTLSVCWRADGAGLSA